MVLAGRFDWVAIVTAGDHCGRSVDERWGGQMGGVVQQRSVVGQNWSGNHRSAEAKAIRG